MLYSYGRPTDSPRNGITKISQQFLEVLESLVAQVAGPGRFEFADQATSFGVDVATAIGQTDQAGATVCRVGPTLEVTVGDEGIDQFAHRLSSDVGVLGEIGDAVA